MVKKDIGSLLALYPMPTTLVGAMVDGMPNWMPIAHVGVVGRDRIAISCEKHHRTNVGIREAGAVSVSLVDRAMLSKVDFAGAHSGRHVDKSGLFSWKPARNGAPVPDDAPLALVCDVEDNYQRDEFDDFDTFMLRIRATLVDEAKLDGKGMPDYAAIAPVLFELPGYSYYETGTRLGACLSFA